MRTMRGLWVLMIVGAALWPVSAAAAIEPPGELGKVTGRHEQRIIGREERGNTFRRPGTILAQAKTPPVQVDAGQLEARRKAMYQGRSFTHGLPSLTASARGPAPAGESRAGSQVATATRSPAGAHYAALLAAPGILLLLVAWIMGQRRRQLAHARQRASSSRQSPAAVPERRRRGRWEDRDLKITMGRGADPQRQD